jgi:hypothetical protein
VARRVAYFDDPALAGLWDDPRLPANGNPVSTNKADPVEAFQDNVMASSWTPAQTPPEPQKESRQEALERARKAFMAKGGKTERNNKKGKIKVMIQGQNLFFPGQSAYEEWLLRCVGWKP